MKYPLHLGKILIEFYLNGFTEFTEFSDTNIAFLKDYSKLPPFVREIKMLPQCQQDTGSRDYL